MSLATRCPACGTIFRVVQDQLKVSDGWVRCGQCQEVFHGIESLFDLGSEPSVPAATPPVVARAPASPAATAPVPASGLYVSENRDPTSETALSTEPDPVIQGSRDAPPAGPVMDDALPQDAITWLPEAAPAAAAPAARATEVSASEVSTPEARATEDEPPGFAGAGDDAAPPTPVTDGDEANLLESRDFASVEMFPATGDMDIEAPSSFDDEAGGASPAPSGSPSHEESPADAMAAPARADAAAPGTEASPAEALQPESAEAPQPEPVGPDSTSQADALAQADIPDDDDDGGPHTLAAMLPEPVGNWPPRRHRARKAPLPAIEARQREAAARTDPRFVREARRGERWTRPWVRASLSVLLLALVLAAVVQVAWPLRDVIAARWPEAQAALALACEQMDCTVEAPRSLASLALDGSSLTRTDTEHVLLFSADLHNRSDHAVRMPSFDLSFMDLNGQIVARKVLAPSEIGIQRTSLAPDAELHVHARLQISGVEATGFQAEMFYP